MKIYIIGSGSSLRGFDFNRLRPYHTMAINNMIDYVPFATHFVALDNIVWNRYEQLLINLPCQKHSLLRYSDTPVHERLNVRLWDWREHLGLDTKPYVCHNWNSGLTGINIAINLGYTDIRLLGFDADNTYCWTDHKNEHGYIIDKCNMIADKLPPNIKITNYSINSLITAFKKRPINICI